MKDTKIEKNSDIEPIVFFKKNDQLLDELEKIRHSYNHEDLSREQLKESLKAFEKVKKSLDRIEPQENIPVGGNHEIFKEC